MDNQLTHLPACLVGTSWPGMMIDFGEAEQQILSQSAATAALRLQQSHCTMVTCVSYLQKQRAPLLTNKCSGHGVNIFVIITVQLEHHKMILRNSHQQV